MIVKTIHMMTINCFAAEVITQHYTAEQAQTHLNLRPGQYEAMQEFAKDFVEGDWKAKCSPYYGYCELDQENTFVVDLEYYIVTEKKQIPTVGVSE